MVVLVAFVSSGPVSPPLIHVFGSMTYKIMLLARILVFKTIFEVPKSLRPFSDSLFKKFIQA